MIQKFSLIHWWCGLSLLYSPTPENDVALKTQKHLRLACSSVNSLQPHQRYWKLFEKANVLFPGASHTAIHTAKPALAFAACGFWYHAISITYLLSSPNHVGRLCVRSWSWQSPDFSCLHQGWTGTRGSIVTFPTLILKKNFQQVWIQP